VSTSPFDSARYEIAIDGAAHDDRWTPTKGRGLYKFLHSAHLDEVVTRGKIKIGSLSHYRGLEGQQWISDRLEGRVKLNPGAMHLTEHDNPLDRMLPSSLVRRHAVAMNGGEIIIEDGVTITIEHPDVFIFSACKGDLESLTEVMCLTAEDPYDACLNIVDLDLLAHRMLFRGILPAHQNQKMWRFFATFHVCDVSYTTLSRGPELGSSPEAGPCLKDLKFASQQEARIVFIPREPIRASSLIVEIPRPRRLLSEVFRAVPPIMPAVTPHPSP
jgi:hypothetical protein